jgi:DNA-binding NarL/FixJ family response regulator
MTLFAPLVYEANSIPTAPIRVLLADDHSVTLWGLRQLVESVHPRLCVSGTSNSCAGLLNHAALPDTDVVLLDLGLGDGNSIDCIAQLVSKCGVKVVLLTGDDNPAHHHKAVLQGARGVVVKSQPTQHILDAIDHVHRGEVWFDGALMALVMGAMPGLPGARAAPDDDATRRIRTLTPKELLVIKALVEHRGAKSLVAADALGMRENTLRNHLTAIYEKLDVQRKLDLYVFAIEHRLGGIPKADRRSAQPPNLWDRPDSAWDLMH